MSVFDIENKSDHTKSLAFLDPHGGVTIQRYETMKYPSIDKLTDKQLGFFWRPEEIDIFQDAKDFKQLNEHEQHIFTSNLKRQILLDSVQGRAPSIAFGPIASLPELENWITTWTFSETIHSRSYTHIIRNVYPDPSKIFDEMMGIEEIVDCAKDISRNYDELIELNNLMQADPVAYKGNEYRHKKALWMALMSVNILEGVRFYVSFACSWAFAEVKKMEGNAKIIKFIARDENLHLAGTQLLLKILPKDDPDFISIAEECRDDAVKMFVAAADQEKAWAQYLFKDGSMIGLNEQLLNEYVEWITTRRMQNVGLTSPYRVGSNPLPWTQKWISGMEVQVAPQETQVQSYTIGAIKQDVGSDTFKGMSL